MKRWMVKDIYAHRGYHDKPSIPENSLAAFRRAARRGWGVEFDVHLLRDGTLAVFHDSSLMRITGHEGVLEDLTLQEMKALRLEGTDEQIPTFDEVLELFEASKGKNGRPCSLIIELKTAGNNHRALTKAVVERLDNYSGDFCIESFDPRAVLDVKKLRPSIIRGQLSMDFFKEKNGVPRLLKIVLTNMWFNIFSDPDFIAYRYEDRAGKPCRRALKNGLRQEASWTLRNKKDFDDALANGCIPIFECFDPEK